MTKKKSKWPTISSIVALFILMFNQLVLFEVLHNSQSLVEENKLSDGSHYFSVEQQNDGLSEAMTLDVQEAEDHKMRLNFKLLLFVTTHMPDSHIFYLKTCWPTLLQSSLLLRSADVLVHLGYDANAEGEDSETEKKIFEQKNLLQQTFHNQKIKIHTVPNIGYQAGAMKALMDASTKGWFDGYDWVIRLNPDVIVRNETYLLNVMQNDPKATGLLINCFHNLKSFYVNTDFFAIRPSSLPRDAFLHKVSDKAEKSFTAAIKSHILDKGGHRWIPGAEPGKSGICRAGDKDKITESTIVHMNMDNINLKTASWKCPIPF